MEKIKAGKPGRFHMSSGVISFRRKIINGLLSRLIPSLIGNRILEVGSGRNSPTKSFFKTASSGAAQGSRLQYITLDPDRNMNPDILGIGENLAFKSAVFDNVICLEVLEHCFDPEKLLLELKRVVKKNGKIILSVPFLLPIHMAQDHWRFSEQGLRLLVANHLKIDSCYKIGDETTALLQIFFMQYRKRALFIVLPFICLLLLVLKRFKFSHIKSTTGYLLVLKK